VTQTERVDANREPDLKVTLIQRRSTSIVSEYVDMCHWIARVLLGDPQVEYKVEVGPSLRWGLSEYGKYLTYRQVDDQ
jgi:hypothetical protein